MRQIDACERQRRLAVRHGLVSAGPGAGRLPGPVEAARSVVALHATDPATVYLSVRARTASSLAPAVIEDSMYERRELVRMLAMRRTVFVVPAECVPVVQVSTTDKIAASQRVLLLKLLSQIDGAVLARGTTPGTPASDPESWLADVERSVLRALTEIGRPATAAELSAAEPRLRTAVRLASGKPYEATQNITSRVLLVLSARGRIVRGKPIGSWLSQQYRWALAEDWLPDAAAGTAGPADEANACAELARQWLAAFGPAPLGDLKWWTGWTMAQVKRAVTALGAVEVDLGGFAGVALPGDLEPTPDPGVWVALLPALDPTVMGWQDRAWFLGPHGPALFDANGNAGPMVWLNGRVVGGWAQRRDGEVAVRLLEDVGADAKALIDAEASRLRDWLGDVRVIPRFRTPTERELSA
jgi:DNA glycosylase AlkZ-like